MDFKILDIGCGDTPIGNFNCDLFVKDVDGHRLLTSRYNLNTKKINNFSICDCQYLPYQSGIFDIVVSRQVIEHIKNPQLMIKEMFRCSNNLVIIETVHRRGERLLNKKDREWSKKHHINNFDFNYFKKISLLYKYKVLKLEVLSYQKLKVLSIPFLTVPLEIRIMLSKKFDNWNLYDFFIHQDNYQKQYLNSLGLN